MLGSTSHPVAAASDEAASCTGNSVTDAVDRVRSQSHVGEKGEGVGESLIYPMLYGKGKIHSCHGNNVWVERKRFGREEGGVRGKWEEWEGRGRSGREEGGVGGKREEWEGRGRSGREVGGKREGSGREEGGKREEWEGRGRSGREEGRVWHLLH